MNTTCTNLEGLLRFEVKYIEKYSPDNATETAKYFFILDSASAMRYIYCGAECPFRYDCAIAQDYIRKYRLGEEP